jgi:hypothetical protein
LIEEKSISLISINIIKMSSVTYTIAEQKVIKAEILASLLRQRAEIDAEIEKKEAQIVAINSLQNQLLNGDAEARAEAARQAFQLAEAEAELRRREADRKDKNKVCCDKCEECYERNGYAHDNFRYNEDGEYGICGYCYDGEYDDGEYEADYDEHENDEEEDEEEPEDLFASLVAQANPK